MTAHAPVWPSLQVASWTDARDTLHMRLQIVGKIRMGPRPDGYAEQPVGPEGAEWNSSLGEFVLPYETVRRSAGPGVTLLQFLNATYAPAADLGHWDRAPLDVDPHRLDGFVNAESRAEI
jgi:hypothetical protein